MKTKAFAAVLLLACTACEQTGQTPGPVNAKFGQEFTLAENQTATLETEGITATVVLDEIEDTRCPAMPGTSEACIVYGSARVKVSATVSGQKVSADVCTGDCRFGLDANRVHIPDTSNVLLRGRRFQVRLLDVLPHPREYYRRGKAIPTRSAKLLVREL